MKRLIMCEGSNELTLINILLENNEKRQSPVWLYYNLECDTINLNFYKNIDRVGQQPTRSFLKQLFTS